MLEQVLEIHGGLGADSLPPILVFKFPSSCFFFLSIASFVEIVLVINNVWFL